ncbi:MULTISPECIES: GNAT family N-acetyltransferase [Streptomyces]|uniref:GNAT family N-acetyltransferase n=1 Tax=Streptomyces TaxID=1883 RepID=UPI0007C82C01|nr:MULTISPECIES: GNAT family N-acetyltransferase [Streptomyces]MDI5907137.1 GNAT family N-acetyltransferase [Streptomyces sp. 12257]
MHDSPPPQLPEPLVALAAAFALLGRPWNGLIIAALAKGPADTAQVRERVPGVSDRMLARRLQELTTGGLVTSTVQPEASARTHYTLSSHGAASLIPLAALTVWAQDHVTTRRTPPSELPEHDAHSRPDIMVSELDLADETTAAAVHRIGRQAYAIEADLIGFHGIPALRESLQAMQAQPLHWLGATTDGGQIVAFVAWQHLPEEDGIDIARLCVDPAWIRRGLASRLLSHLTTSLAPHGHVLVSTDADNLPAIALYERHGFSRVGTTEPAPNLRMAQFRFTRQHTQPTRTEFRRKAFDGRRKQA